MFLYYILYFYILLSDPCASVTDIDSFLILIFFHLLFQNLANEIKLNNCIHVLLQ